MKSVIEVILKIPIRDFLEISLRLLTRLSNNVINSVRTAYKPINGKSMADTGLMEYRKSLVNLNN